MIFSVSEFLSCPVVHSPDVVGKRKEHGQEAPQNQTLPWLTAWLNTPPKRLHEEQSAGSKSNWIGQEQPADGGQPGFGTHAPEIKASGLSTRPSAFRAHSKPA